MDVGESRMERIKSKTHERLGLKNPACRSSQQHTHTVCILRVCIPRWIHSHVEFTRVLLEYCGIRILLSRTRVIMQLLLAS